MKLKLLTFFLSIYSISGIAQFEFDSCLVAYYPFNGNMKDETGNGHDGFTSYAPTLVNDRFGIANSAYNFDGIDDYIQISDATDLNAPDFTICAWYKTVSFFGAGWAVVGKNYYDHNPPYYQYQIDVTGDLYTGGHARFRASVSVNGNLNSVGTLDDYWTPGSWYFLAMTYDQNYLKFYIDGQLFGSLNTGGNYNVYNQDLYIGHIYANGYNRWTPGSIDDVRIYSCALGDEQVSDLYLYNESPVGVSSISEQEIPKLFPNPAHDQLTIQSAGEHDEVIITDAVGKVVFTGFGMDQIDLSKLENGVYFLQLFDSDHLMKLNQKLIKN